MHFPRHHLYSKKDEQMLLAVQDGEISPVCLRNILLLYSYICCINMFTKHGKWSYEIQINSNLWEKEPYNICEIHRRRSALTSEQSDWRLCCSRIVGIFWKLIFDKRSYFKPCYKKSCLRDFRPGQPDTNQSVQLQKMTRCL